MTKPKWKAPTPEELERPADWCYRYGLPSGSQVVIRGDGRKFARDRLAEVLPAWERVWCYGTENGTQAVVRGVFPREREIVPRFNLAALKRELSAEHFSLVKKLYEALKEQALVASYAVGVAEVELGTAAKRSAGGKRTAAIFKREAAARDADLKAEAEKIRTDNQSLSASDVGRILAERLGVRGAGAIRRKIPKRLRK